MCFQLSPHWQRLAMDFSPQKNFCRQISCTFNYGSPNSFLLEMISLGHMEDKRGRSTLRHFHKIPLCRRLGT